MKLFGKWLVEKTGKFLTWRKKRKLEKKERQKNKNQILDWIEALVWAACVVLLINQYLLQAFVIPSQSMENSLLAGDRIFVNKIVYGPELVPGFGKLPGFREPEKSDVVIFETPEYNKKTPAFELTNRLLFMLTLTFVNLNEIMYNETVQFLVKRYIAGGGDTVKFHNQELYIKPSGSNEWITETRWKKALGFEYSHKYEKGNLSHFLAFQIKDVSEYVYSLLNKNELPEYMKSNLREKYTVLQQALKKTGVRYSIDDEGRVILHQSGNSLQSYQDPTFEEGEFSAAVRDLYETINLLHGNYNNSDNLEMIFNYHQYDFLYWQDFFHYQVSCHDRSVGSRYYKQEAGMFIPEGMILPLGDNRNNSNDGRIFGPIKKDRILGEAMFKYWPLNRFGPIE